MKKTLLAVVLLMAAFAVSAQDRLYKNEFPIGDVTLLDGPFKHARDLNLDVLGYVDPGVTVNVIENGKLKEKKKIELPTELTGVIRCKNPRCITSSEPSLPHRFRLADPNGPVYRCVYCEARAKTDK